SENDDSQANANPLNLSGTGGIAVGKVAGALPAADSAGDYYRLNTLTTGNTITVTADLPSFGTLVTGDVRLSLHLSGVHTALATSTSGTLGYTVAADGTYYVRVEGLNHRALRAQYF